MSESPTSPSYRFRGFISYSWQDRAQVDALYALLEKYKVPREFVGRKTKIGEVPARLGQFYIDRKGAKPGPVSEVFREALTQSEYLIVMCSPSSRASAHVANEIRTFKSLGRGGNIHPIIVAGKPNCPDYDCFPNALKWQVEPDGTVSNEVGEEILAPNVSDGSDSPEMAVFKTIAPMLGLEPLDLLQGQARAQRRRRQFATVVAGMMTVLACAAVWFGFEARKMAQIAEQRLDLSIGIANDLANLVGQKTSSLKIPGRQALELQQPLSKKLHELKQLTGREELRWRIEAEDQLRLAKITRSFDAVENWGARAEAARDGFRKLIVLNSSDLDYQKGLGDALMQIGSNLRDNGLPNEAQKIFSEALAVRSQLVRALPDINNEGTSDRAGEYKDDLSSTYIELGKIDKLQGNIDAAYQNLREAKSLREEIAAVAQSDVARFKITEVDVEIADIDGLSGNHAQQVKVLERVVAERRERLRNNDENEVKRLLAWSLVYLGEAYLESGNNAEAEKCLQDARQFQYEVFVTDTKSARFQKDLAWAEGYWGKALLASGRVTDSVRRFDEAVKIAKTAEAGDPLNESKSRDLAYWLTYRGRAKGEAELHQTAVDDLDLAVKKLRGAVFVSESETEYLDRSNRQYRVELATANLALARSLKASGNSTRAAEAQASAHTILLEITEASPQAGRWRSVAEDAGLDLPLPVTRGPPLDEAGAPTFVAAPK